MMKVSSCVSALLSLAVAVLPRSVAATEFGCHAPSAADFVVPDFDGIPGLPPDKNVQLLLTLLESLIPSIKNGYETPMAIRFTNLIDTLSWNCVASYHPSFKSSFKLSKNKRKERRMADDSDIFTVVADDDEDEENEKRYPLIRSQDVATHTTDARQLCGIYAVAAAVPDLFGYDPSATETFLAGFPAVVLGIDESLMGLPADLLDLCPDGAKDRKCLKEYLQCHGFSPKAVGAVVAYQVVDYSRQDGFNSEGKIGRGGRICTANCRPFQDSSSYDPEDLADVTGCRSALLPDGSDSCWEPLVEDNGKGYFTRQEHVSPHIGFNAIPRVLSQQDVQDREVDPPTYDYSTEINDVFARVGSITDESKMMIEFGDDKIAVAQMILGAMLGQFGLRSLGGLLSYENIIWWLLGYTASELDAVITVWKEKVRYNLIRPTTVAQRLNPTETVETYVKGVDGPTTIEQGDFQSYIRVMPHAEYPSGSSCLFMAAYEWTNPALAFLLPPEQFDADNFPLAQPCKAGSSKVEPGTTPAQDITLQFSNMFEFIGAGGESRLDGGMHFSDAVPAGYALCSGIGGDALEWALKLVGNEPF